MFIDIETKGNIGIIGMKHPGTNSLDIEFLNEIFDAVNILEENEDIHVVIMASKLKFGFSSGLDLKRLFVPDNQEQTATNIINIVRKVYEINLRILGSKKVYLAVLSGPVIGSAASIAFCCDFRVSDEGSWIWLPDPQYGGLLADGGIDVLKKLVGVSRANMLTMTNDRINAAKAYEWGLFYTIVSRDLLLETAFKLGTRLTEYSFDTISATKEIMNLNIIEDFKRTALKQIVNSKDTFSRLQAYLKNTCKGRD